METLTTARLRLRPVVADDAGDVHDGMASDFEVVRHTGSWPWPADAQETARRCAGGFSGIGGWMVAHDGDQLVGTVGMGPKGDFGYMLPRAAWGQGYATEMSRAFIDHVFASRMTDALNACVFTDNPASARVLEKLGFTEGPACEGRCEARHGTFPTRTFTLERVPPQSGARPRA